MIGGRVQSFYQPPRHRPPAYFRPLPKHGEGLDWMDGQAAGFHEIQ